MQSFFLRAANGVLIISFWHFPFRRLFLQPSHKEAAGEVDEWLKSVVC